MNDSLVTPKTTVTPQTEILLNEGNYIKETVQKTENILSKDQVQMLYEIAELKSVLANVVALLKNSNSNKDFFKKGNAFVHKSEQDLFQRYKNVIVPLIDYLRHKVKKEDVNDFPNQLEVDLKFFADFLNNYHN